MTEKPTTGQVLAEEIFELNAWAMQAVDKFPRNHKYLIGDRILTAALHLMLAVVEATYTRDRARLLRQAQMQIETLRFLFRLANHAGIVNHSSYEHAARMIDRIGRGVGGWRKAHDAHSARQSLRPDRDLRGAADGSAEGDPG